MSIFKKKQIQMKKECCLALILKEKEGYVLALELDRKQKAVHKIDEKKIAFSESWDLITEHIDDALFQLEQNNNCTMKEVIFFLYGNIVDQKNKQIKKTYFQQIKNIIKELELKPLGYIDYQEAVSIYFSEKEQRALTAIIIEIDIHLVSLFIYKNGNLVYSESLKRLDSITADIEKLFSSTKGEIVLPSRILMYDSFTHEEKLGEVVAYQWRENLFIQIPQFEILSEDQLLTALLFAFTAQLFESTPTEVLGFTIGEEKQEEKKGERNGFAFISHLVKAGKACLAPVKHIFTMIISKSRMLTFFIVIIVCAILLSASMVYFFHTAEVVIALQSKLIEKTMDISGVLGESSIEDMLKINTNERSVEKSESIDTTGKKTIGEKAHGEVTIYNLLESEKIFKKDTIFASDKGTQFLLDEEVKIASAAPTFTSDGNKLIVTGKTKASLSANSIGAEGNINKDQKLKIEDFPLSSYFASPIDSFSGGSKKDVQTVSKDDLKKLKDSVLKQMTQEKDTSTKSAKTSLTMIDQLTTAHLDDEIYSKELGEEAKNVSLHAKGSVYSYSYDADEMRLIIARFSTEFVPSGYHLPLDNISYTISDARKEDDKKITLSLNVKERAVIQVRENKIMEDIKGKNIDAIEKILKEKYKVQNDTIEVKSPLPFLKSRLPFFTKNITLTVKSLSTDR